ncbi:PREDICTED: serine-protein kinase ATM [Nicrophorus vespilloides]|uniref:non-specific serine/threonine protein kinase n=1 Tax=Nicrophorus vespilloides TaxID=110193 RepID=A0ABM1MPN3_NICVS|nr:PREDICTED: serine-protein kinase ATM [Nicrophorus vespilloides]
MSLKENLCNLFSKKLNDRKSGTENLFNLINNKRTIDYLENPDVDLDWNDIYSNVFKALVQELQRIDGNKLNGVKTPNSNFVMVNSLKDLLVSIVKVANRKRGQIEFKSIHQSLKKCINETTYRDLCLKEFLLIMREHVLPKFMYWITITKEEWNDLLTDLDNVRTYNEDSAKAIICIQQCMFHGSKHKLQRAGFKQHYEIIVNISKTVTIASQGWMKESLLEMVLTFCKNHMNDCRMLCCELGETILGNLIQLYENYAKQNNITLLLLEIFIIQLKIHHPNGASENETYAYANSWPAWKRILKFLYSFIDNVFKISDKFLLQYAENKKYFHPLFAKFAVEVFKQKNHVYDPISDATQKRVCADFGFMQLVDEIEGSKNWTWIYLCNEIIKKYPKLLCATAYIRLLKFLANYIFECKLAYEYTLVFNCLTSLLDMESVFGREQLREQEIDVIWTSLWDTSLKVLGLAMNTEENHNFIRRMIVLKKAPRNNQLIMMYKLKKVKISEDSLKTLNLLCSEHCLTDNSERDLLHWVMQNDIYEHFQCAVYAETIVHLILTQWPKVSELGLKVTDQRHSDGRDDLNVEEFRNIDQSLRSDDVQISATVHKDYVINREAFEELLDLLGNLCEKVANNDIENVNNIFYVMICFLNIVNYFKIYKIDDGVKSLIILLRKLNEGTVWDISVKLLKKANERGRFLNKEIIQLLQKVFSVDLEDAIKVPVDFISTAFSFLAVEEEGQDVENPIDVKVNSAKESMNLEILNMICQFAFASNGGGELRSQAKQVLLNPTLDFNNDIQYEQMITVLRFTKRTENISFMDVLEILKRICQDRYQEHRIASDILEIVYNVLENTLLHDYEDLYALLDPFYDGRHNYSIDIIMKLVDCYGMIGDMKAMFMIADFLLHDSIMVRMNAIKTFTNILKKQRLFDYGVFEMQKDFFKKICIVNEKLFETVIEIGDDDGLSNRLATVLYALGSIICYCSAFRKIALFELFKISHIQDIDLHKLSKMIKIISKEIGCENSYAFLENSLDYLLLQWITKGFSLKKFPYTLLGCLTDSNFYNTYMSSILPILFNEKEETDFENICEKIGCSVQNVIKEAYPFVKIRSLVESNLEDSKLNEVINRRLTKYLPEDDRKQLIENRIDDVFIAAIQFVFDMDDFKIIFNMDYCLPLPDTTHVDIAGFQNILTLLQEDINWANFMEVLITKKDKLQQILLKLTKKIHKATSREERILSFYRYVVFLQLIHPQLIDRRFCLNNYLIRDITYTLVNLIDGNINEVHKLAIIYLKKFINDILPGCVTAFQEYLPVIVGSLVPIADQTTEISDDAMNVMNIIFQENAKRLEEGLKYLDPLPDKDRFSELRLLHHKVKYDQVNCALGQEIEYFLKAGELVTRAGCRTEGLKYLRSKLKTKKDELKILYNELYLYRGVSNSTSNLHKLVYKLMDLAISTDSAESLEATKCIGELGSADLTTMVLKNEEPHDDLNAKPTHLAAARIMTSLIHFLVDQNIDVVCATSDALYSILKCNEGNSAANKLIPRSIQYLKPFICTTKTKQINMEVDNKFLEVIKNEDLWCPERILDHNQWIVSLTSEILNCINKPEWYKTLIPLCKLKVSFAESLLPLLVNIIVEQNNKYFKIISESIGMFFEKHWDLHWNGKNNECGLVMMQKPSVKCMLTTVHFIRLHRNTLSNASNLKTNVELQINHLHVALAAQFCSAHFSASMFAELWCQREIVKKANVLNNNASVLATICETSDDSKALKSILKETYRNIGDKDALLPCQLIDPCDLPHYIQFHKSIDFETSLINCGLYELAANNNSASVQYECLWRLGRWDGLSEREPTNTFDCHYYSALKALNDNDLVSLGESVERARSVLLESFRHESLESCKHLYKSTTEFQCLHELEDVKKAVATDNYKHFLIDWLIKDSINPNEFKYVERILSHRIAILNILVSNDNTEVMSDLIDYQLKLSSLARSQSNFNVARRCVDNLQKNMYMDELSKQKITLEHAQIIWNIHKPTGMYMLKDLLKEAGGDERFVSKSLKLYGHWSIESKSETTESIISNYFLKSIDLLNKYRARDSSSEIVDEICDSYDVLACFVDEKYQEIMDYIESPLFQDKIKKMETFKKSECEVKSKTRSSNYDERVAAITYSKQSNIDETEIGITLKEKNNYLELAVKYYLLNLKFSNKSNIKLYRVISLWLNNKSNVELMAKINVNLPKVPSYKLLAVLPQLVPHITNNDDDSFGQLVNSLVENCAKEHPHHVIPIILSVSHSDKDSEYSDTSLITRNEPRTLGAQIMITRLKQISKIKRIIEQLEDTTLALIQLAYYNTDLSKGTNVHSENFFKIPNTFKIRKIRNYDDALLVTCNLDIKPNCDYGNIVGIYKYDLEYNLVGGINAPKRIKCTGTDGIARRQLVKGKDDLRQDAVMQQVFEMLNELLAGNKETFNLRIRTYKILPLSQRSGVLEWVEDSMTIGEYLTGTKNRPGAHKMYNPGDITPESCHNQLKSVQDMPSDRKLAVYNKICKQLRPVFHKFFETTFLYSTEWYEKRRAYTQSVATTSICGYILGLGDRHLNNILLDKKTAEVIHIDFGIAFEQGKALKTPETVPFRLTRDIVDGMGISGVDGCYTSSCEKTMSVLRNNVNTITAILEVLLYDPLYIWKITPYRVLNCQKEINDDAITSLETAPVNLTAERALSRLRQKLLGIEWGQFYTVEQQVARLIQEAKNPENLSKLFCGWRPYL